MIDGSSAATKLVSLPRSTKAREVTIGCRFSADEFLPGGLNLEDTVQYARALESAGVDYLSVSAGVYASFKRIIPPMDVPSGWLLPRSAWADDEAARREVVAFLERYRSAIETRDLDALAGLYAQFPPEQRDALRAYQREYARKRRAKAATITQASAETAERSSKSHSQSHSSSASRFAVS